MMRRRRLDPPRQLADRVAEDLRERILTGELASGEWLRQEHIAQELGVSFMPVREAFNRLASEGLLEHLPYRGFRVLRVSIEDAEDLFFCRAYVEGRAARFAAQNISDEELEELVRVRQEIKQAIADGRVSDYLGLNVEFHAIIIAASHRNLLERSLNSIWSAYPTMLWPNFRKHTKDHLDSRFVDDEEEHDAIMQALLARDPAAAEQAMRHHIMTSSEALLSTVTSED